MNPKLSIRFFNDHEVRAIWDEEKSQWWFSVLDIVGAITESPNPRKYWSVLKTRLKKNGNELTTRCSQLKLTASDGKKYATDCLSQDDIQELAKVMPSKKTQIFLDWFTYSDNSIDGQSRKKAYTFIESNLVADSDKGIAADPRLHFWRIVRFCWQNPYKDDFKGRHDVLSCGIFAGQSQENRTNATKYF